ncbi:MAG: cation diffusion facilitator family transporter [Chroococcales cyanobacterium]
MRKTGMVNIGGFPNLSAMAQNTNRYRNSRLYLFSILWLTLFLLSVKVSTGWMTDSLSLLTESLHTLITGFSALLSLFATRNPDTPPGRSVYGHGKRETIVVLVLVAFLGFICLHLLNIAVQQLIALFSGEDTLFNLNVSLSLFQLLGIIILMSMALFLIGIYLAKAQRNPTLKFNANQLFKDASLTFLVTIGLSFGWRGWLWVDPLVSIVILGLVVFNFWQVICWQLPLFVEQMAIAPEEISHLVRQVGGVTHCYDIKSRGIVGRFVQIQMHLILHPDFNGVTSILAERIEAIIQDAYGDVQVIFYIDDDLAQPEIPINFTPSSDNLSSNPHSSAQLNEDS